MNVRLEPPPVIHIILPAATLVLACCVEYFVYALYHLKDDIWEATNLMADHPQVAKRRATALQVHLVRSQR